MRNFILVLAAIGLLIWSLLAWAASGLIGVAGGIAATTAPFIPLPPELVLWMAGLLSGAGGIVVWIVWFLGAAVIAIVTMTLLALIRPREDVHASPGFQAGGYEPINPKVRDVTPPRPQAGNDTRSGEEIVARVLGKSPRR